MTETTGTTATPRLERPRESAFRGVCSAVARTTGTDPVLWRVLVVALTLFNGLGILLYVAGAFAIPLEGERQSLAERLFKGPDRRLTAGQSAVVVILVIAGVSYLGDPSDIVVVAVAAMLGLILLRQHHHGTTTTVVAPPPLPAPVLEQDQPVWTAPPPQPPRPRSPLAGLTASLAAIVAGVLVLIGVTGTSVPTEVVLAAALGVVGLGLVVGAFLGRSWVLVLLATGLGIALAATLAVRPIVDDGVGERTWHPTGSSSYRLGVGEATLDLSDVRESTDLTAHLEVGHLLVLVPDGVGVDVRAKARLGDVEVFGKEENGRRPSQHVLVPAAGGQPTLTLDLSVRTGYVEVRRS